MNILNIIKGHFNESINKNYNLSEKRMDICKQCPLFSDKSYGFVCSNDKWLNPETNDVSYTPKDDFIRGCGCRLKAKTTLRSEKCPVGKW